MKSLTFLNIKAFFTLGILAVAVCSCEKDEKGMPDIKAGSLQVNKIEPDSASGGDVLVVNGSGLGSLKSIMFEKDNVPAGFNPTFNSDEAIVFRVPDTAGGGQQNIIFTNSAGVVTKVPFKVIALPTLSESSAIDVEPGMNVTLTGINFEDVNKVVVAGTTTEVPIVSKSKKQLVVTIPPSDISRAKFSITNSSGTRVTDQEFTYLPNTFAIYSDALSSNIDNYSWSTEFKPSTTNKISGANGLSAEYLGAWAGIQLSQKVAVDLAPYKYLTFWTKGSASDRVITLNFNWAKGINVTIPANKWTYHKIDLDTFKGAGVSSLTNFIMQINGDPDLFYFDNIVLVK
jgi:hypothetical protein